jgi:glycosyltransferase involved in cell wall biosynthesis
MHILLTNIWMTGRGGSESVTRDLARGLIALGHSPTVYTPLIGQPGLELGASGVPVIDDLRLLKEPPDVIHGHHSVPTVEAIVRFPRTPVVNVCHAWSFGVEAPVAFPQVQFHVGVDEVCMERIAHARGIDPSRIYLIPNGVDLKRIPARPRRLPSKPQKAVVFGKATVLLPLLLEICAELGIELEAIGPPMGRPVAGPEAVLVKADLVFASARAALEALCAGCAVVVCDERGVAGRATTQNYKELRRNNFGLRCLTRLASTANLRAEIESYDAGDAEALAAVAREDADVTKVIDQYLQLYRKSIDDMRLRPVVEDDYSLVLSGFLRDVLPRNTPNPARSPDELGRDVVGRLLQLAEENLRLKRELAAAEADIT